MKRWNILVVQLIKHSFEIPPLEELALESNGKPFFTSTSHGLQLENQKTLWEIYIRTGLPLPEGPILDAGAGDGILFAIAPHMVFSRQDIGRRTIVGVDIDKNKVWKARQVANTVSENYRQKTGLSLVYQVQDPQDLAEMDTKNLIFYGQKANMPKFAMVWSNSMFHWIKEPRQKYAALEKFYSVMKEGGVLCISMSSGGTARDFRAAYINVFKGLGFYDIHANEQGFRVQDFEDDPIGSRPLDEIVNMIESNGFQVVSSVTLQESIAYNDPREYSKAVETYGQDAFLRSVPHYGKERKAHIWKEIEKEFIRIIGKGKWKEGQPWEYSQFNNYIVAVRKKSKMPPKKISHYDLTSILNEQFIALGYNKILIGDDYEIMVHLEGNEKEIEKESTVVDVQGILREVFTYAAKYRAQNGQIPCIVKYEKLDRMCLELEISVKTNKDLPITGIIKENFLDLLNEQGVVIEHKRIDSEITSVYKFKIPL